VKETVSDEDREVQWLASSFHREATAKQKERLVIFKAAIGPASFVVNAADLAPPTGGNLLVKYADDTYLIVPATNVDSHALDPSWTMLKRGLNNLALNRFEAIDGTEIEKRKLCCLPLSDSRYQTLVVHQDTWR